jgi:hypothetical protein
MNQELTQRLVKRFPILYQNYSSPMTQTCMCWGFDHGDGWFEIIWQLSLAIEAELNYSWLRKRWFLFKKSFFRRWNNHVYKLSPAHRDKHTRVGSGTVSDPYRWVLVERAPGDWLARMTSKLFGEKDEETSRKCHGSIRRLGFKTFLRWPHTGLAVQQVKEKFGTLRFYCGGTEAIHRYIQLAERLSSITCEECGEQGTANGSGWISTLCEECRAAPRSSSLNSFSTSKSGTD